MVLDLHGAGCRLGRLSGFRTPLSYYSRILSCNKNRVCSTFSLSTALVHMIFGSTDGLTDVDFFANLGMRPF